MAEPKITPDRIAEQASPFDDDQDVVVLQGWLGPKAADDTYRLFTSIRWDEWLVIKKADLLFQLPGDEEKAGASLVWVKSEGVLVKGHKAKACDVAEGFEIDIDPTNPAGKPRYGVHRSP